VARLCGLATGKSLRSLEENLCAHASTSAAIGGGAENICWPRVFLAVTQSEQSTVILPAIRRSRRWRKRDAFFDAIERGFAWQARITTPIAGLTGFYTLIWLDLWSRFLFASYWWMHAMIITWLIFTVMLILHRLLYPRAQVDPEATFRLIEKLYLFLLTLSATTVFSAAGVHGLLILE
jgi:hypothetical protein